MSTTLGLVLPKTAFAHATRVWSSPKQTNKPMTHKLLLAGVTAVSLLFNTLNAHAELGDTYAQMCKRWAQPVNVDHSSWAIITWQAKNNWQIDAIFRHNICVYTRYRSTIPSAPVDATLLRFLLLPNEYLPGPARSGDESRYLDRKALRLGR